MSMMLKGFSREIKCFNNIKVNIGLCYNRFAKKNCNNDHVFRKIKLFTLLLVIQYSHNIETAVLTYILFT